MRYSAQLELVGWKNKASKGVLVIHLEEVEDGDNPQLANIGIDASGTLGKWAVGQKQTFVYAAFDPKKFAKATDYTLFIGSSTNENCEKAMIIHSQHSELISKAQMKNFGGSAMEPHFKPQKLLNDQTIMQNFASLANDRFDPLMRVLSKNDFLPPAFPVAMQFGPIMYNPNDHEKLGDMPAGAVPFWKKLPPNARVAPISVLPTTPEGFKLLVYYYLENPATGFFDPFYIIVPNSFLPNPNLKVNKVPVLVRSKKVYPNLSRAVVKVDMVVHYFPKVPKSKPKPPTKPKLPTMKERMALLFPRIQQAKGRVLPKKTKSLAAGSQAPQLAKRETSNQTTSSPQFTPVNVTRVCKKYKFEVVLNVRRDQWNYLPNLPESLQALMNECEEWDYVVTGGEPIPASPANTTTPSSPTPQGPSAPSAPKPTPAGGETPAGQPTSTPGTPAANTTVVPDELIRQFCKKRELHVVLNRESAPEVQDYVRHFCQNLLVNGQRVTSSDRTAALARLRQDYTQYLARRVLSHPARSADGQLVLHTTTLPN